MGFIQNISIEAISYYLPENFFEVKSLQNSKSDWGIDKVISKTGIHRCYYADKDETAVDMAVKVGEKFFYENHVSKSDIGSLIFVTQSPDYALPTSACIIQDRLGLPKDILGFDINLGCSGFINTLAVAVSMIDSGLTTSCLIICSETYSKYLSSDDKSTKTLFSDAASACLVKKGGNFQIGKFKFGIDGSGSHNLIVKGSASKELLPDENKKLFMNGRQIFLFTLDEIPKMVNELLLANKININDVSQFFFHQASELVLKNLTLKFNLNDDKVFNNLKLLGNTVSNTIPISLKQAMDQKIIKKDSTLLLLGFGVGYSWGGTIIKWGN